MQENQSQRRVRFAEFAADFELRELLRDGKRLPLQRKPFRILELLLRRPGCLVTRQELAHELWPGLRVSFEKNLNTAVNALRLALGDSPRDSRFIETRPGLGYRFIAPVIEEGEPSNRQANNLVLISHDSQHDYLKGRYFLNKMTAVDVHKAIAHFHAALEEDPECILAYAGLAEAYSLLALHGASRAGEVCQQARAHALTAIQRSAGLAEAHVSFARVKMTFDWDWTGARTDCLRACDLAPQLSDAHRCYATLLSASAQHIDAACSARRACDLEPLSLAAGTTLSWSLYLAHDFTAAEQQCWKMLTLEPNFAYAQTILGLVYEQQQANYSDAIIELENARHSSSGEPATIAALGHAFAIAGERAKALDVLDQLGAASSYSLAVVYCGLAEQNLALQSLEQAIRERDPLLLWLNVDPRLDPLRGHSTFDKFVQRVGFRPAAATAAY